MEDEPEFLTWNQRFKRMMKHYGWTYGVVASLLDCSADSIRSVVNNNKRELSHPWKLAVIIFEVEHGLKDVAIFL